MRTVHGFPILLDTYENFDLTSPFITLRLIVWSMFAGICLAAIGSVYSKRLLGSAVRGLLKAEATSPETAKTLAEIGCDKNIFVKHALRNQTSVLRKSIYSAAGDNFYVIPERVAGIYDKDGDSESGRSQTNDGDIDAKLDFIKTSEDKAEADAAPDKDALRRARAKLSFKQRVRLFFTGTSEAPVKADVENGRFYIPEPLTARAEIRYEKKGTDLFMFGVTVIAFFIIAILAEKYIPELISMLDGFITNVKS